MWSQKRRKRNKKKKRRSQNISLKIRSVRFLFPFAIPLIPLEGISVDEKKKLFLGSFPPHQVWLYCPAKAIRWFIRGFPNHPGKQFNICLFSNTWYKARWCRETLQSYWINAEMLSSISSELVIQTDRISTPRRWPVNHFSGPPRVCGGGVRLQPMRNWPNTGFYLGDATS